MAKNEFQKLIQETSGERPIAFNPALAKVLGSISAGLFFSQLLYWWGKGSEPGVIYKTIKETEEETGLSKHQQLNAQKLCVGKGVLKVSYKGIPPKRHFKIDIEKTIHLLRHIDEEKGTKTAKKRSGIGNSNIAKVDEPMVENLPHITESTPKSTSEKTQRCRTYSTSAQGARKYGLTELRMDLPEILRKHPQPKQSIREDGKQEGKVL